MIVRRQIYTIFREVQNPSWNTPLSTFPPFNMGKNKGFRFDHFLKISRP
jgi:hypothetical protein